MSKKDKEKDITSEVSAPVEKKVEDSQPQPLPVTKTTVEPEYTGGGTYFIGDDGVRRKV
jgi:hypothetical protein